MRITPREFAAIGKGKALPRPEADVQKAIVSLLEHTPGVLLTWRNNSRVVMMPGRRDGQLRPVRFGGKKGSPDVMAVMAPGGRFIAVEVKQVGKKATDYQRSFLERIREAGGIGIVAYSVDDVIKALGANGTEV